MQRSAVCRPGTAIVAVLAEPSTFDIALCENIHSPRRYMYTLYNFKNAAARVRSRRRRARAAPSAPALSANHFAGSDVSIWALMRSPDGRIGHRERVCKDRVRAAARRARRAAPVRIYQRVQDAQLASIADPDPQMDPMDIVAHFEKNPMHAIVLLLIVYRCATHLLCARVPPRIFF
jgi:hypothetical protein